MPEISKIPLDEGSVKTRRGRPGIRQSEITGRADNYRRMFWTYRLRNKNKKENEWVRDKPYEWATKLVAAKTVDEASHALDSAPLYAQNEFKRLIPLILKVLKGRSFPKRQKNQLDFLADSLAGEGRVGPRRSREICSEARAIERTKSPHKILRKEFYIECSCGYKGPARDNACRKCRAEIPLSLDGLFGSGFF